jgi:hypothetical protein
LDLKRRKYIFLAAIAAVLFFSLLRDIRANDFFWHLKTGEWIWQHGALPSDDPFSFTTQGLDRIRDHFVLTSYWLSQVLYYLLYLTGGFPAIVLLRFLVMGFLVFFLLRRTPPIPPPGIHYGLTVLTTILLADLFATDRPQMFSFLFFAVLLVLLQKKIGTTSFFGTKKGSCPYFLLPLLMLVWSNMHAGFVVGIATIALYIICEGLKLLSPSLNPMPRADYRKFALICVIAIGVSLINPNTRHFLSGNIIFQHSYVTADSLDYQSAVRAFTASKAYSLLIYFFFLLMAVVGALGTLKKVNISELLLLLGTGFFSFISVRYVPFFMIAALPAVARYLSGLPKAKIVSVGIAVIALCSTAVVVWSEAGNVRNISKSASWVNDFKYPVAAAEFIDKAGLDGNMYNNFNWGGYLIWKLAPERKVFIDGRILDSNVYLDAMSINNASAAWKSLLNTYRINYVVIPIFTRDGGVQPLLNALLADNEWALIFYGFDSVIFIKDLPENYKITSRYYTQKESFAAELAAARNRPGPGGTGR